MERGGLGSSCANDPILSITVVIALSHVVAELVAKTFVKTNLKEVVNTFVVLLGLSFRASFWLVVFRH